MKRLWLVLVLALFGGIFALAKFSATRAVHYELRSSTQIIQGIRPTPYTEYWYQEVRGIKRTTLWYTKRMERYKQHWISPSGVVWIETEGFIGPGGHGSVWAGDTKGIIPEANFGSSSQFSLKTVSGLAESLRGGIGEVFVVNKGLSDERKFLLFRKAGTPTYAFETTITATHPRFLIEDLLRSSDLDDPSFQSVGSDSWNTFLVTEKSRKRALPDSYLMISGRKFSVSHEPAPITSLEERSLTGTPGQMVTTPSGYLAYFVFDSDEQKGKAWFEVRSSDGHFCYKADLSNLGGYRSVAEAKGTIQPKISWLAPEGWLELPHQFPNNYARVYDKFDFNDNRGKRFEVSIKCKDFQFTSGNTIVQSGLAARRKIVETYPRDSVRWSRRDDSPNGVFHVTAESTNWTEGSSSNYINILLTATVSDHGKPIEVQLYRTVTYGEVWPRVSNSGRVFLFEVGKTNTENQRDVDLAKINIDGVPPVNSGGIGLVLVETPGLGVAKYRTNAEAKKGILWDKMKIVSRGDKTTHQFLGVDLPLWEIEEFWIPQANGPTIHQAIVNGNFVPTKIVAGQQKLMIPEK